MDLAPKNLGPKYAEHEQKVIEFIHAMLILNNDPVKDGLIENAQREVNNQFDANGRVLTTLSSWLKMVIDEQGKVTDIVFRDGNEKNFDGENADSVKVEDLFRNYDKVREESSVTGADAVTIGEMVYRYVDADGAIKYASFKCFVQEEMKHYWSKYQPTIKTSNLITEDRIADTKSIEVLRDIGLFSDQTIKRYNGITDDVIEKKYEVVKTYQTPGGGVINVRNVIETFQKAYNIYPDDEGTYLTASEFLNKLTIRGNELGVDLVTTFKKAIMEANIKAMWQGEVALKTDENGLVIIDGTLFSIKSEKDSLGNFDKRTIDLDTPTNTKAEEYVAYTQIFGGLKNKDGQTIDIDDDSVKLSQYSMFYKEKMNGENAEITTSNVITLKIGDETYYASPAIFYNEKHKNFYTLTPDGSVIEADNFKELKEAIENYLTNENILTIEDFYTKGLLLSSLVCEEAGFTLKGHVNLALYRLQQLVLHGGELNTFGEKNSRITIHNSIKNANQHLPLDIAYLNSFLVNRNTYRDLRTTVKKYTDGCTEHYMKYKRLQTGLLKTEEWDSIKIGDEEWRALMGGVDMVHMNAGLGLLTPEGLSETEHRFSPWGAEYRKSLNDIMNDKNTNWKNLGIAEQASNRLIDLMARYVTDGTMKRRIIGITSGKESLVDKKFVEVGKSKKIDLGNDETINIYDIANLKEVFPKIDNGKLKYETRIDGYYMYITAEHDGNVLYLKGSELKHVQFIETYIDKYKEVKEGNVEDFKTWLNEPCGFNQEHTNKDYVLLIDEAIRRATGEDKVQTGVVIKDERGLPRAPYLPIGMLKYGDMTYLKLKSNAKSLLDQMFIKDIDVFYTQSSSNMKGELRANVLKKYTGIIIDPQDSGTKYKEDLEEAFTKHIKNNPMTVINQEPGLKMILEQKYPNKQTFTWEDVIKVTEEISGQSSTSHGRFDFNLINNYDRHETFSGTFDNTVARIIIADFTMRMYELFTDYGRYQPITEEADRFNAKRNKDYSWVLTDSTKYKDYKQVFDEVRLWKHKQTQEKIDKGQKIDQQDVLQASDIDTYIKEMGYTDKNIQYDILIGIQDILNNEKMSSLKGQGDDRYERSESEKVQRALYQYVKAQIAIDEIGLIGKKELAKFLSAYMVGRAWQTVMEIGKQAHRVSFGSDIGKLLRAQLKHIISTDSEAKYIDSLTAQHFWHAFNIESYTNARRKD